MSASDVSCPDISVRARSTVENQVCSGRVDHSFRGRVDDGRGRLHGWPHRGDGREIEAAVRPAEVAPGQRCRRLDQLGQSLTAEGIGTVGDLPHRTRGLADGGQRGGQVPHRSGGELVCAGRVLFDSVGELTCIRQVPGSDCGSQGGDLALDRGQFPLRQQAGAGQPGQAEEHQAAHHDRPDRHRASPSAGPGGGVSPRLRRRKSRLLVRTREPALSICQELTLRRRPDSSRTVPPTSRPRPTTPIPATANPVEANPPSLPEPLPGAVVAGRIVPGRIPVTLVDGVDLDVHRRGGRGSLPNDCVGPGDSVR